MKTTTQNPPAAGQAAALKWSTHQASDSTHSADDGVMTYWTAAPGLSMREVATAFLRGYDVGERHEGEAVSFLVRDLAGGEELEFSGLPNGGAS